MSIAWRTCREPDIVDGVVSGDRYSGCGVLPPSGVSASEIEESGLERVRGHCFALGDLAASFGAYVDAR